MSRALLFLTALSLFGQPPPSASDAYATTDDGSQMYFVSSYFLRGSTGETPHPKLFKYDGTNISLVTEIPHTLGVLEFYAVLEPRVSGDGSVVGYVATPGCGNSCPVIGGFQTTLQFPGAAAPLKLPYYCQISRNAKYALCVTGQPSLQQVAIINLSTMQMSAPQLTECHERNLITSDGRALAWDGNRITLFSATSVQQIPGTAQGCPVISDDGSTIVYVTQAPFFYSAYNVATGATTALRQCSVFCGGSVAISNDGKLVLSSNTLLPTNGGASFLLNGVNDNLGILSGSGLVVYADLSKIDVATRVVTQITPPTPLLFPQGTLVPGSYYSIFALNMGAPSASATSFPGPTKLAGVQLLLNGTPLPLLSVSPNEVAFQLPWETPASASMELLADTGSAFIQGPTTLSIVPFAPNPIGQAIKEDFTAVIGPQNPANPGDVVNFYLNGLGAVTVPVADGVPTPASPFPLTAKSIAVFYGTTPLKVYYAGLAPGLIGIYQLTVQTPLQVPKNPTYPGPLPVQLGIPLVGTAFVPLYVYMNASQ